MITPDPYDELTPQQQAVVDRWQRMFPQSAKEKSIMSFKDLEKVLEATEPKFREDPYKFAFIRCLREINGNLDSIALVVRAMVECLDKMQLALHHANELQTETHANNDAVIRAQQQRIAQLELVVAELEDSKLKRASKK